MRRRSSAAGAAIARLDDIDGIGRGDVVVGLEIMSGARQAVVVTNLVPRMALGESSAHGPNRYHALQSGTAHHFLRLTSPSPHRGGPPSRCSAAAPARSVGTIGFPPVSALGFAF